MFQESQITNASPARRQIDQIASTPLRNISRVDSDTNRTYAWVVQVRRKNCVAKKMFSDGVYGGKRQALREAVHFHAQCMAEISRYEYQIWWRTLMRRNNKSGIPGVGRYESARNPKTGRRAVFWLASWIDEYGKGRKRKFSVLRYGENLAKQLAIDERERQLQRVCALSRDVALFTDS